MRRIVDITADELIVDEYDALAIPGGFMEHNYYDEAYNERFSEIIRQFHEKDKIIASICTGIKDLMGFHVPVNGEAMP